MGLGGWVGNPSMLDILSCRVPIMLNTIWDSAAKLKTVGVAASQEVSSKDVRGDTEIVSTGVFLPHKYAFCLIEVPSVFIRYRLTRRNLDQPDQMMAIMKNYVTYSI